MDNCYEYRCGHDVTHFHELITDMNSKPIAIVLYEPDQKEIRFFKKTDEIKKTEFPLK